MHPDSVPTHPSIEGWCEYVNHRLEAADLWFGHGTDNAWDEAVWLVSHCLSGVTVGEDASSFDVARLMALDTESPDFPSRELSTAQQDAILALLDLRIDSRQPLAYLLNVAWFAGLPFYVDDRVIVPRAHLGEWILDAFHPWIPQDRSVKRVLDIGTGSGCIAIALAHAFPEAQIDATDLDRNALAVAAINAQLHGVSDRVQFIEADVYPPLTSKLMSDVASSTQGYDIICSNPPYVDINTYKSMPAEYLCEPQLAFVADDLGTSIAQEILQSAPSYLAKGGTVFIEVGTARPALEARMSKMPLTWLASSEEEDVILMIDEATLKAASVD